MGQIYLLAHLHSFAKNKSNTFPLRGEFRGDVHLHLWGRERNGYVGQRQQGLDPRERREVQMIGR